MSGYQQYIESGCWKCTSSPTGAHHWIEQDSSHFACKYCQATRVMPVTIYDALDSTFLITSVRKRPVTRGDMVPRRRRGHKF